MQESELGARLSAIEEQLAEIKSRPRFYGPRDDCKPTTQRGMVLKMLYDSGGWLSSTEIEDAMGFDVTRPLTRLFYQYLVNRRRDGRYEYTISPLGVEVIEMHGEQTQLSEDESQENVENSADPWDNTELNRSQYHALKVVSQVEGHNSAEALAEAYAKSGFAEYSNGIPAINARLSELFKMGYVGRPPEQPYYYWVTDDGKQILNDA
jgi:DNA-binding transcriptional ArsR family regulator